MLREALRGLARERGDIRVLEGPLKDITGCESAVVGSSLRIVPWGKTQHSMRLRGTAERSLRNVRAAFEEASARG
jgi:hypothetical protein